MASDRPRIARFHARDFRSLRDVTLELGDLTVLVGRNAAGKSNLVDVLRFARDVLANGGEQAVSAREGSGAVVAFSADGGSVEVLVHSPDLDVRLDVLVHRGGWTEVSKVARPPWAGDWSAVSDQGRDLFEWLRKARFYDLDPTSLGEPQRVLRASPLQEDAGNLVSVLREVLAGPDGRTLRDSVSALTSGVEGIEVRSLGAHLVAELIYPDGKGEPRRSDLGLESDGTVWLVAVLTALYQLPSPSLIVLEEPERHVYPGGLAVLADAIKEVSTRTQVVVTTHSPDLIDHFDPDDIWVVERSDGATTVGRMDATQRQIVRDRLFSTGELMRMQGLQPMTDD